MDEEDVEGQDEATVKPSLDREVPGYSPGSYVVAADIHFADGTKASAYVYSAKPDDLGCLQPTVLLRGGQVNFWLGVLLEQDLSGNYALMEKTEDQVFPLSVNTRANINGAPLTATIDSFKGIDKSREVVSRR